MQCQTCGKDFQPHAGNIKKGFGKYCSQICFTNSGNRTGKPKQIYKFICKHCEKEFERCGSDKHNHTFCSLDCSAKFHSGKNHSTYTEYNITCKYCGKVFIRHGSDLHNVQFCSRECYDKNRTYEWDDTKGGKYICQFCGKEFNKFKSNHYYF